MPGNGAAASALGGLAEPPGTAAGASAGLMALPSGSAVLADLSRCAAASGSPSAGRLGAGSASNSPMSGPGAANQGCDQSRKLAHLSPSLQLPAPPLPPGGQADAAGVMRSLPTARHAKVAVLQLFQR